MKCNQSRPGFELVSPYSFPTTITTTPRANKVSTWYSCWPSGLRFSWMGFDPGFERPTCVATPKSSDGTKQSVCGWQYLSIYIYIYIYTIIYTIYIIYIYVKMMLANLHMLLGNCCFFFSFRIFAQLSLLLYSQCFGQCVLRPSTNVSRRNREIYGTPNRTLYLIHGVDCFNSVKYNRITVITYCKYFLLFYL